MKIGILTHYYDTHNYGGILQAYALVEFLKKSGFDAEQICYELDLRPFCYKTDVKTCQEEKKAENGDLIKSDFLCRVIRSIEYRYNYYIKGTLENLIYKIYLRRYLGKRYEKFLEFQNLIPHSKKVYTTENIDDILPNYDCFIAGSDQIWNFGWFSPVFYLEFVGSDKKKIIYAASAGKSQFNEKEIAYLRKVLPTFDAISVREKDLVMAYKAIVEGVFPRFVVDPVFLLDVDDWNKISKERLVKGKYLLSFFLGDDDQTKILAQRYAKKKKLKLVAIPFCMGFNETDISYGDKRMDVAGPRDFVSLIKYSECVFTDSFHATAFSIIFKKDFFVFERGRSGEMTSRIESITKLAGCEESFCNTNNRKTMEYIINKKQKDYKTEALQNLKKESREFLLFSLIGRG